MTEALRFRDDTSFILVWGPPVLYIVLIVVAAITSVWLRGYLNVYT